MAFKNIQRSHIQSQSQTTPFVTSLCLQKGGIKFIIIACLTDCFGALYIKINNQKQRE